MPSQSVLEQKKAIVAELSERLKSSITGVVVSYEGINTEDDTKLRKELRENDVKYTVEKNTLLSRACEEAGLDDIKPVLEGTTAIATSDSEYAAAARILCNYAKDHDNFKVKSAYLDGAVIDMDTIVALSKLQQEKFFLQMFLVHSRHLSHPLHVPYRLSLTRAALKLVLLRQQKRLLLRQKLLQQNNRLQLIKILLIIILEVNYNGIRENYCYY